MDKYTFVRNLGKGAFGMAMLMRQKKDKKLVVIKQIAQSNVSENYLNEVEILSMINHPHIVKYYGYFVEDFHLNIILEYADKSDLDHFLRGLKKHNELLPESDVLHVFGQICQAVHYLHSHKIMHRDLKSNNIFLRHPLDVKLGDFGISKLLNSTNSCAKTCIGTPNYMAPEIFDSIPYGKSADIWALGCILYELVTLKLAFDATNILALILRISTAEFSPLPDSIHPDICDLITQMLSVKPESRPSIDKVISVPIVAHAIDKLLHPGVETLTCKTVEFRPEILTDDEAADSSGSDVDFEYFNPSVAHPVPAVKVPGPPVPRVKVAAALVPSVGPTGKPSKRGAAPPRGDAPSAPSAASHDERSISPRSMKSSLVSPQKPSKHEQQQRDAGLASPEAIAKKILPQVSLCSSSIVCQYLEWEAKGWIVLSPPPPPLQDPHIDFVDVKAVQEQQRREVLRLCHRLGKQIELDRDSGTTETKKRLIQSPNYGRMFDGSYLSNSPFRDQASRQRK